MSVSCETCWLLPPQAHAGASEIRMQSFLRYTTPKSDSLASTHNLLGVIWICGGARMLLQKSLCDCDAPAATYRQVLHCKRDSREPKESSKKHLPRNRINITSRQEKTTKSHHIKSPFRSFVQTPIFSVSPSSFSSSSYSNKHHHHPEIVMNIITATARSTLHFCHAVIKHHHHDLGQGVQSGYCYHRVHASPLLPSNAHILRLTFEL